jgi:release factor glutamine methyltransferase
LTAIDVSEDALALARENAERMGLAVELVCHDLFAGLPGGDWDLVVSNPPYVREDELESLAPEVVDWEPGLALVDRGHTETLVRAAGQALRPGGALVLETHEEDADVAASLLEREGFAAVRTTQDLAGRDRVVEGRRPA